MAIASGLADINEMARRNADKDRGDNEQFRVHDTVSAKALAATMTRKPKGK